MDDKSFCKDISLKLDFEILNLLKSVQGRNGLRFMELAKQTNTGKGKLGYHLKHLLKDGKITKCNERYQITERGLNSWKKLVDRFDFRRNLKAFSTESRLKALDGLVTSMAIYTPKIMGDVSKKDEQVIKTYWEKCYSKFLKQHPTFSQFDISFSAVDGQIKTSVNLQRNKVQIAYR